MKVEPGFVYGAWWRLIVDDRAAQVKMTQAEFVAALKIALEQHDGDVDEAMAALLREMVRRVKQL